MEIKTMKAVIYTRTSTRDQDLSHGAQELDCQRHAQTLGITDTVTFSDRVSGASHPSKRPALLKALKALSTGDLFLTAKRDRIGRDIVVTRQIEALVESRGAQVISLDTCNDDSAMARFQRNITDAQAEHYRDYIRERTKRALEEKKRRGEALGSPQRGYKADENGFLVVDEQEKAMTDQVREWKQEGLTLAQIRERCVTHNITTRRGSTPGLSTIAKWTADISTPSKKQKAGPKPGTPSTIRVEANSAGLLATILDLKAQGQSLQKIAEELTNRGYKTRKGTPYTKTQVWRIIDRNS